MDSELFFIDKKGEYDNEVDKVNTKLQQVETEEVNEKQENILPMVSSDFDQVSECTLKLLNSVEPEIITNITTPSPKKLVIKRNENQYKVYITHKTVHISTQELQNFFLKRSIKVTNIERKSEYSCVITYISTQEEKNNIYLFNKEYILPGKYIHINEYLFCDKCNTDGHLSKVCRNNESIYTSSLHRENKSKSRSKDRSISPKSLIRDRSRSRSRSRLVYHIYSEESRHYERNVNEERRFCDEYECLFVRRIMDLLEEKNKSSLKMVISWFNDQRSLMKNILNVNIKRVSNDYTDNYELKKILMNMYSYAFCTYQKIK
jgi:hypothetical protein